MLFCASSLLAQPWPDAVERALTLAGDNRSVLERVLVQTRAHDDPLRFRAACFLIANMEDHGYSEIGVIDADGKEVPFDALEYSTLDAAKQAWRALEEEHGPLRFGRVRFHSDLQTITADFLIENIDQAFRAWKSLSWARHVQFEAFCENVLPYRASNEPLEPWRTTCQERLATMPSSEADGDRGFESVGDRIAAAASEWVGFSDLYYLHPTDQGLSQLLASGEGRCEDISNVVTYALRASAICAAADYTPYWADFSNNHAWTVVLDGEGRGSIDLFHRAAKVYRKTYSLQSDSLAFAHTPDEPIPAWLSAKTYRDVTSQYYDTIDVGLRLESPTKQRFAYLCVFNLGEWKPIHWSRAGEGRALFTEMNGGVLYLPGEFTGDGIEPLGRPFVLEANGHCRFLEPRFDEPVADAAARAAVRPDGRSDVYLWRNGRWTPWVGRDVPSNALWWRVRRGSRREERPFTLEASGVRSW